MCMHKCMDSSFSSEVVPNAPPSPAFIDWVLSMRRKTLLSGNTLITRAFLIIVFSIPSPVYEHMYTHTHTGIPYAWQLDLQPTLPHPLPPNGSTGNREARHHPHTLGSTVGQELRGSLPQAGPTTTSPQHPDHTPASNNPIHVQS